MTGWGGGCQAEHKSEGHCGPESLSSPPALPCVEPTVKTSATRLGVAAGENRIDPSFQVLENRIDFFPSPGSRELSVCLSVRVALSPSFLPLDILLPSLFSYKLRVLSCMGSYLVAVTSMKPKEVDMEEAEE